jgi:hypothetical protein
MLVSPEAAIMQNIGRSALDLPGWEDFSVWGWDARDGELYAQLWRNTDDPRDMPRVWISTSAGWPRSTAMPELLAGWIAEATGEDKAAVLQAMATSLGDHDGARLRRLAAVPNSSRWRG